MDDAQLGAYTCHSSSATQRTCWQSWGCSSLYTRADVVASGSGVGCGAAAALVVVGGFGMRRIAIISHCPGGKVAKRGGASRTCPVPLMKAQS